VPPHLIVSSCTLKTDLLEPGNHVAGGDKRHVRYRTPKARQSNESRHRNMVRNQYLGRRLRRLPETTRNRRQLWQKVKGAT
jgi:hypothetical protein